MRGALKITFHDGSFEYFEVEPVGDRADFADRLRSFLAAPNVTLLLRDQLVVIPAGSIREISITRTALNEDELADIPGVWAATKRIMG